MGFVKILLIIFVLPFVLPFPGTLETSPLFKFGFLTVQLEGDIVIIKGLLKLSQFIQTSTPS